MGTEDICLMYYCSNVLIYTRHLLYKSIRQLIKKGIYFSTIHHSICNACSAVGLSPDCFAKHSLIVFQISSSASFSSSATPWRGSCLVRPLNSVTPHEYTSVDFECLTSLDATSVGRKSAVPIEWPTSSMFVSTAQLKSVNAHLGLTFVYFWSRLRGFMSLWRIPTWWRKVTAANKSFATWYASCTDNRYTSQ